MDEAAILAIIAGFTTEFLKRLFPKAAWFRRIGPLIPIMAAFGATWIPGLGMDFSSLGERIGLVFAAQGMAGSTYALIKRNVSAKKTAK